MPPFVDTFRALPARSKGVIAVSAVAILAIAFLMLRIAGAPSYTLMSSGLDPAQTGKVTAALDEQGIGYELRNNGTALAVEKSQTAQARVALAGEVRGIAQLVASSVKGLKTENVTITDASGSLLWPAGDGTGDGGVAAGKQALEARFDRQL